MQINEVWKAVLGELEVILSKASFTTWFKNSSLVSVEKNCAIISVPNQFSIVWYKQHYHSHILKILKKYYPEIDSLQYQVLSPHVSSQLNLASPGLKLNQASKPQPLSQPPPGYLANLNPNFSFETFVTGNANRLAFAASQAVAQAPGRIHNPLFIYGGVGLGKTHLLHAIGNSILKQKPKTKILYTSCEDFCNEFISSLQNRSTNKFKQKYRGIDVFLVDDIQFLSRKEGTQQEFFHTFNSLHQKNRQIVMTSDRLPREIPYLEDRLSSRFGAGLVADLQIPDGETRQAILKSKAQSRDWQVPQDIIEYLASNIKTNVRELEGALNRLMAQSLILQQTLTLEFTQKTLEGIIGASSRKNFDAHQVIKQVAKFFEVKEKDLLGTSRERRLVRPRQIIMYLLRDELKLTFPKIAEILGGRDHTTVMHGVKLIDGLQKKDQDLNNNLTLIKEGLYSSN